MHGRALVLAYALSVMLVERAGARVGLMLSGKWKMVTGAGGCGRGDVRAGRALSCFVHKTFSARMRSATGVNGRYCTSEFATACVAAALHRYSRRNRLRTVLCEPGGRTGRGRGRVKLGAVEEPLGRKFIVGSGTKRVGEVQVDGEVGRVKVWMMVAPLRKRRPVADVFCAGRSGVSFLVWRRAAGDGSRVGRSTRRPWLMATL